MKNKKILIALTGLLFVSGCGMKPDPKSEKPAETMDLAEEPEETIVPEPEFDLDISGKYVHSSGAGGWSDEMEMDESGHFQGVFHDSDVDEVVVYGYSGDLTDLKQEGDLKYSATVKNLKREEVNTDSMFPGMSVAEGEESPMFHEGDRITVYLKGYPLAELSDVQKSWIQSIVPLVNATTLEGPFLYNEKEERGSMAFIEYDVPMETFEPIGMDSTLQSDLTSGTGTWSTDTIWPSDMIEDDRVVSIHFNPDMSVDLKMGYTKPGTESKGQYVILDENTIQFKNLIINGERYNDTPIHVWVGKGKDLDPSAEIGYSTLRIERARNGEKDILFDSSYLLEQ